MGGRWKKRVKGGGYYYQPQEEAGGTRLLRFLRSSNCAVSCGVPSRMEPYDKRCVVSTSTSGWCVAGFSQMLGHLLKVPVHSERRRRGLNVHTLSSWTGITLNPPLVPRLIGVLLDL